MIKDINNHKSDNWKALWAITCQSLWYWRNQRMCIDEYVMPQNLAKDIKDKVQHYFKNLELNNKIATRKKEVKQAHWSPASGEWITLNTDGSVNHAGLARC